MKRKLPPITQNNKRQRNTPSTQPHSHTLSSDYNACKSEQDKANKLVEQRIARAQDLGFTDDKEYWRIRKPLKDWVVSNYPEKRKILSLKVTSRNSIAAAVVMSAIKATTPTETTAINTDTRIQQIKRWINNNIETELEELQKKAILNTKNLQSLQKDAKQTPNRLPLLEMQTSHSAQTQQHVYNNASNSRMNNTNLTILLDAIEYNEQLNGVPVSPPPPYRTEQNTPLTRNNIPVLPHWIPPLQENKPGALPSWANKVTKTAAQELDSLLGTLHEPAKWTERTKWNPTTKQLV